MITTFKALFRVVPQRLQQLLAEFRLNVAGVEAAAVVASGWADMMLAVCFASAFEIALLSAQLGSQSHQHRHLSPLFLSASLALLLAFSSFCISKFLAPLFPKPALLLDRAGVVFVVTGFFIAMSIPLPYCLRVVTWTIYAVCLLVILICSYFIGIE